MGQGNSARDFGPSESMENAGILDVFPIFHAARLGQKIRRSPLLPLCGVALNQAILEMASFRDTSQTDNIEFSKVRSLGYYLIAEREMTGGRLLIVFERRRICHHGSKTAHSLPSLCCALSLPMSCYTPSLLTK